STSGTDPGICSSSTAPRRPRWTGCASSSESSAEACPCPGSTATPSPRPPLGGPPSTSPSTGRADKRLSSDPLHPHLHLVPHLEVLLELGAVEHRVAPVEG